MKSIIKCEKRESKSEYPCLKENVNEYGKIVVLFIAPGTGMVVFSDGERSGVNPVGEISGMTLKDKSCNEWWLEDIYMPFNGVIELSNN
jgi:hypothetical protein